MSARVYLFADFGKGPRHMGRAWNQATAEPIPYRTALHAAALAGTQYVIAGPVALRATAARAWWLVECESAEAGRQVIDAASFTESQTIYRKSDGTRAAGDGPMPDSYALLGRIIASGGAA